MTSNGICENQNDDAGLIEPLYQLGTPWEAKNNQQSRKKHGKMYNKICYFNNMSKRTWNRLNINVPENIEEEKELREVEHQIEKSQRILHLVNSSGYEIGQINGQRRLGPLPGWTGPPPSPKCEVFVGKLPRDLYEDEIFPLFSKIGKVYEIRLMMDFSGNNRGYCFVMFTKPEHAEKAITELDNHEIRPRCKIGVVPSINNCRLTVSHLPPNLNVKAFVKKVYEMTKEVANITVYRSQDGHVKSAMISYKTHIGAAMARRKLVPDKSHFFEGSELIVDWACPKINFQNTADECGMIDKNGQVKITKNLYTNKKCKRYPYKSEILNGSLGLGDNKAFEKQEDTGRSSTNSMRSNFLGHHGNEQFIDYRNPSNKQRTMSESDLFKGNVNLSLRPLSKQLMLPKMRGSYNNLNNIHKSNLINSNSRNYKSNLDLSKTNFNHHNYSETVNSLNHVIMNQETNRSTAMNCQPMHLSNSTISASLQNFASKNICIDESSSMMNLDTLNTQSSLRDRFNWDEYFSTENILPFFNKHLNFESEPSYAEKGFLNDTPNNGFNHDYSLMSNGNDVFDCVTNENSYVQPNFSNFSWNVDQHNNVEKMNEMARFEALNNPASLSNYNQVPNYYPGVVNNEHYYNDISIPPNYGGSFEYNCYENNQYFFNNINAMEPLFNYCNNENTPRITLNDIGAICKPEFDTKAFGLDKMQPTIFQRSPRPILSRYFSEHDK